MTRYLIHWFPFCSGGLCDRILGLASSLCIADVLGMKVLIKWDHSDLSSGFTIKDEYNYYKNPVSYRHINMTNIESIDYFKHIDIVKDWKDDNVLYWSNINLFCYMIENTHMSRFIFDDYIGHFSFNIRKILHDIFIIHVSILQSVPQYKSGIHIRTGDRQIYDKNQEESYREYITNIFKTVREVEEIEFISSDCILACEISKDYFKNIKWNEGRVVHTSNENKIDDEGVHKVLRDLLTLCRCSERLHIGWHSNFSRIAALYNLNRKIITYEYENNLGVINECYIEALFSYFSSGKYT